MSERPSVYHARWPAEQWVSAVNQLSQNGALQFIYAEEPANIYLERFRLPDPRWTHGRAFGPTLEVRWSKRYDGQVDVTVLTESTLTLGSNWRRVEDWDKTNVVAEDGTTMLLGVFKQHRMAPGGGGPNAPAEWADARVPHPLLYPVQATPNDRWARLKVKTYRVNGCPVLTRMVNVEVTSHATQL